MGKARIIKGQEDLSENDHYVACRAMLRDCMFIIEEEVDLGKAMKLSKGRQNPRGAFVIELIHPHHDEPVWRYQQLFQYLSEKALFPL